MSWFEDFRGQLCLPAGDFANLNAGTLSQTPIAVMNAANRLRAEQASSPHNFVFHRSGELLAGSRSALAKFLGGAQSSLFLLPNVTWAIDLAIQAAARLRQEGGLYRKRRVVLVSSIEYGSLMLAWAAQPGIELKVVPVHTCQSPDEIVDAFAKRIDQRTLAIFASHVSCCNGFVLPVKSLVSLARRHGALSIIDGAHAVGLMPLDLHSLNADVYGGNLHKWLMGPATAGFLYATGKLKRALRPLVHSWGIKGDFEKHPDDPSPAFGGTQLQAALEFHGTSDRVPQMVVPEMLEFWRKLGFERAKRRMRQLSRYAIEQFGQRFEPVVQQDDQRQWAMTAFRFPSCNRAAFRKWMWENHRVAASVTRIREDHEDAEGDSRFPNFLRISTGWYTQEKEIDRAVRAMDQLLQAKPRKVFNL